MEETKFLYFKDSSERRYRQRLEKAFRWAVEEQKKHNFLSRPARFEFHGEDAMEYDRKICHAAMFYNEDKDWAILRRDWPEKLATSYNVIINYDEIKRVAPNSLKELLENGIKMSEEYAAAKL